MYMEREMTGVGELSSEKSLMALVMGRGLESSGRFQDALRSLGKMPG